MPIVNPYAGPGDNLPVKICLSVKEYREDKARAFEEGQAAAKREMEIETMQRGQADCPGWCEHED